VSLVSQIGMRAGVVAPALNFYGCLALGSCTNEVKDFSEFKASVSLLDL